MTVVEDTAMRDPRFWDSDYYAERRRNRGEPEHCPHSLELMVEGNRLLALAIAAGFRKLWDAFSRPRLPTSRWFLPL